MNIFNVLWSGALMGGLGLVFGLVLSAASRIFAIERDERWDEVREALPGANCGMCGFTGCDNYATAIIEGAAVNRCPVGGASVQQRLGEIMNVGGGAAAMRKRIAIVACQGTSAVAKDRMAYEGIQDCVSAQLIGGGFKSCEYGCLGLGTCVKACQFDAIHINSEGIAQVDEEKCKSCNACVVACPRNVIRMTYADQTPQVLCNSLDKGKDVRTACAVGCIACMRCQKTCEFDAIHVVNNLAVIDEDKCTHCMKCVEVCPVKCIKLTGEAIGLVS